MHTKKNLASRRRRRPKKTCTWIENVACVDRTLYGLMWGIDVYCLELLHISWPMPYCCCSYRVSLCISNDQVYSIIYAKMILWWKQLSNSRDGHKTIKLKHIESWFMCLLISSPYEYFMFSCIIKLVTLDTGRSIRYCCSNCFDNKSKNGFYSRYAGPQTWIRFFFSSCSCVHAVLIPNGEN